MTTHSTFALGTTVVELLQTHALLRPSTAAFTYLHSEETSVTLSVAELDARARAIAACLDERGLRGHSVLILCPPGLNYVCCLVGAWYAGAIAVPAYPPSHVTLARADARIALIAADAQASVALTTSEIAGRVDLGLDTIACDEIALSRGCTWTPPQLRAADPCLLQYTSGSTAEPKGVVVTHANLLANEAMIAQAAALTSADVILSWLPPYHDMGLIGGIIAPLCAGAHGVLMAPDAFIRKPLRWLRALTRLRATVSMTPNFAFDLCVRRIAPAERASLDLSSLRLLCTGAEPINPASIDAFCTAFGPYGLRRTAIYPCYGLAEATLMVSGSALDSEPVIREFSTEALEQDRAQEDASSGREQTGTLRRIVGCGRPVRGARLRIVNPTTQLELRDQSVGEIWVQSAAVAAGYWRQPEQTKETFEAHLQDTGEGPFLRTGDLGFFHTGELFVTGRLKDLIIVRGRNHHPQDIERTLQSVDPALTVGSGAAFAIERAGQERLIVVQELDHRAGSDPAALTERVVEAVTRQHQVAPEAVVLIKRGSLLKTSSGKVQRGATRQAYLRGQLQIVPSVRPRAPQRVSEPARPASDETHERPKRGPSVSEFLRERLAALAGIAANELDDHAPLAMYGVDSIAAAQLTSELEQFLGRELPSTLSYENPSITELVRALEGDCKLPPTRLPRANTLQSQAAARAPQPADDPLAIVGMACRFPGAANLKAFWEVLRYGVDTITEVPEGRWDIDALYDPDPSKPGKMSSRWGGFVEGIDQFDPAFFGISRHEAARIDPQQRLFLEVAWEALEDAGVVPSDLAGTETGVFVGAASSDYALLYRGAMQLVDADYGPGNAPSVIANRLSYFLNLNGPSLTFDTACSSSLVALQAACRSLRLGETTTCIVGGVNAVLSPEATIFFSKARALARDGRCKTFDARADGFVRSEGCGAILLKPLSRALADGDRVYAVVAGSAVNHDGASNGLLAPSGAAQQRLISRALADAKLCVDDLDYIEAHGVGAKLADLVEARAIGALMQARTVNAPCLVGSVKTNLGHLEAASGMAGVIKTALALRHEEIPPHLHLQNVDPELDTPALRLSIPTVPTAWARSQRPRFAGVSAFGLGGCNAHVVLGEAPALAVAPAAGAGSQQHERPVHVLTLHARDLESLARLAACHARQLERAPLADICFTANTGRARLPYRAAFVATHVDDLGNTLRRFADTAAPVTPLRTVRKPRLALSFPEHAAPMADARAFYDTQPEFRAALDHAATVLCTTATVFFADSAGAAPIDPQVRCAVVQYGLLCLLRSWGVVPDIVLGQGVGELVAAVGCGVLEPSDALRLVHHRAQVLRSLVPTGLVTRSLHAFKTELQAATYQPTKLTFVSGASGCAFAPGNVPAYAHWLDHLYHAPMEVDGRPALLALHPDLTLELGPNTSYRSLADGLATLYTLGAPVDWHAFDAPFARRKVPIPSYPFARQRCWLDFPTDTAAGAMRAPRASSLDHPLLQRMTSTPGQSTTVRKAPEDKTG